MATPSRPSKLGSFEWRVMIERPKLHGPSVLHRSDDLEEIRLRLKAAREQYAKDEPATVIRLERRLVLAWVDGESLPTDDDLWAVRLQTRAEAIHQASCDNGHCDRPADYIAFSEAHGWLPVCDRCMGLVELEGGITEGPFVDVTN